MIKISHVMTVYTIKLLFVVYVYNSVFIRIQHYRNNNEVFYICIAS